MRENLERRRQTRSDEEEDARRRPMEFRRWICTTRCMENKMQSRWKGSIIHRQRGGEGRGQIAQRASRSFYEEGRLIDAARDGTSHSGVLLRVQLQHQAAASPKAKHGHVDSWEDSLKKKKKKKAVPIHHVFLFSLIQHTRKNQTKKKTKQKQATHLCQWIHLPQPEWHFWNNIN